MDQKLVFINQAMIGERAYHAGAAVDQHIASRLLLHLLDLFRRDLPEQRRVVPVSAGQRRGEDDLAHRVQLARVFALTLRDVGIVRHMGPGAGKALIGHTPQEQRVGSAHSLILILAHFLIYHHPVHGFVWTRNEAVKGDPRRGDDLSHALLLLRLSRLGRRHYGSFGWRRLVQKRRLLGRLFSRI